VNVAKIKNMKKNEVDVISSKTLQLNGIMIEHACFYLDPLNGHNMQLARPGTRAAKIY